MNALISNSRGGLFKLPPQALDSKSKDDEWIKDNLDFDQLIAEFPAGGKASWLHVSYRKGRNRKQILVATKKAGKTIYLPYSEGKSLLY